MSFCDLDLTQTPRLPTENGARLVFGTDTGIYLGTTLDPTHAPIRVIQAVNVTQVDVIEEHGILLVLADKAVMTFWLDSLDPHDAMGAAKRARKISSNASFFKVGDCLGRKLVCVVKSGSVSSTIKTLEPSDHVNTRGKHKPLRKIIVGSNDALKVYKVSKMMRVSSDFFRLMSWLCFTGIFLPLLSSISATVVEPIRSSIFLRNQVRFTS